MSNYYDAAEQAADYELNAEYHTATPGEAHAEWHLNAGVPMGQPGCPQDACHLLYEDDDEEVHCLDWAKRLDTQDRINRDYPDSPIPPAWFDPANAGETWDDSEDNIPF